MTLPELPKTTLNLRVDTQALADNWRTLDRMSGNARAGAAVKANAYGIGVDLAVPALQDAGAETFFVAHWQEVPQVLQHVAAPSIAVLHGVSSPAEAHYARETGVRPVINSLHQAQLWIESGSGPCDLMIDTGINRLGIGLAESGTALLQKLEVDMLMSHLASADEDSSLNEAQRSRFREVSTQIGHKQASLANSAGIALGADYHFDVTRPGLALYGGVPRAELAGLIKQVAFPEAAILQRRKLSAGESVGYNATFTAGEEIEVATVSIGYADGLLRKLGPALALQHGGHTFPILGKISMDMIVVDCSANPSLKEGDFLEIPYDLPQLTQKSGISQYELLTCLGNRFTRF